MKREQRDLQPFIRKTEPVAPPPYCPATMLPRNFIELEIYRDYKQSLSRKPMPAIPASDTDSGSAAPNKEALIPKKHTAITKATMARLRRFLSECKKNNVTKISSVDFLSSFDNSEKKARHYTRILVGMGNIVYIGNGSGEDFRRKYYTITNYTIRENDHEIQKSVPMRVRARLEYFLREAQQRGLRECTVAVMADILGLSKENAGYTKDKLVQMGILEQCGKAEERYAKTKIYTIKRYEI